MSNYKSALASLAADTRAIREAMAKLAGDRFVMQPGMKQWMADELADDFDRGHEMILPERAPEKRPVSHVVHLHWSQVESTMQTARHGDWRFTIQRRRAAYSLGSGRVYEYAASAREYTTGFHDLGTHADSNIARQKCADFINAKAEGVST